MRTYTLVEKVQNFAILSRLSVLALQTLSNFIIPDHDADAFVSPADPKLPKMFGDSIIDFLFQGLVRWDAQYFIHIAEYGYTHENTLAFFPLFPMLVRGIGSVLYIPLQFFCNYHSTLIISAVAFNFFLFVKTAVIFFKLSQEVLCSDALAYKSALLFCINPASIFFSAPYSETVFSYLIFSALLLSENKNSLMCPINFGLACAARSNGLVNIGFLIYHKLQGAAAYYYKIRNARTESGTLSIVVVVILTFNYTLIPLIAGCFAVFLPFALFQLWCYYVYCKEEGTNMSMPPHLELFLRSKFLHSPDLGEAEWCYNVPPLAYSHIQEKYWEVGAFKYYELKQIPNFLLALPVVMSVICHAALYMVDNPEVCLSLGVPPLVEKSKKDHKTSAWYKDGVNSWRVFVYTAHSLVLCIFCVLCIHVQVTTRLLCSSSPIVYWFAANILLDSSKANLTPKENYYEEVRPESISNMNTRFKVNIFDIPKCFWAQLILCYFVFYFAIGTILFSNFFPWT